MMINQIRKERKGDRKKVEEEGEKEILRQDGRRRSWQTSVQL